jgi:hypothetical protein
MAMHGQIPIEFGMVFPGGAYAAGGIEMVRDFERSTADRVVQQADKHSVILSFRVSRGCDLQRAVVDSVVEGTLAA